jgi:hypothetical protein
MLYSEIIAVCSQIHTKHINTLCGQNIYFLYVKPGGAGKGVPVQDLNLRVALRILDFGTR